MNSPTCLPSNFSAFKSKKKRIKNVEAKTLLNRFAYRYRLARSFISINAPEVGNTLDGYNAILKLFLAYTAYEEIVKAGYELKLPNVKHISTNVRSNLTLAEKIRKNEKLKHFLLTHFDGNDQKNMLELFFKGTINDIVCVAYALRSIFAHGDLTPTAIGVTTKPAREIVVALANDLLDYSDKVFTDCMGYA